MRNDEQLGPDASADATAGTTVGAPPAAVEAAPVGSSRRKLLVLGAAAVPVALTMRPSMAWATTLRGTVQIPALTVRENNQGICWISTGSSVGAPPQGVTQTVVPATNYTVQDLVANNGPSDLTTAGRAHRTYIQWLQSNASTPRPGVSALVSLQATPVAKPGWLTVTNVMNLPNSCAPTP